jgi:hypothetical protein
MAQKTHRVSFAPKLTGANLPVEARTGPAGEVILGHSPAIHSGHSHFTEASSLGDPIALCIAMVHQEIMLVRRVTLDSNRFFRTFGAGFKLRLKH